METQRVPLSSLVRDFSLYPRVKVDGHHASYIAEAIRAGGNVPPIIVDKASWRIVDGFHRYLAYQRLAEPETDPEVEVELRSYKTERDLFLDAVRLNAHHGRALTSYDRQHVIGLAERFLVNVSDLAMDLAVTENKIIELRASMGRKHFAISPTPEDGDDDGTVTSSPSRIPLKRMIRHMRDRELTARQIEAQEHLLGVEQSALVSQLILLIENRLVDTDNPRMMTALCRLRELLDHMPELDEIAASA